MLNIFTAFDAVAIAWFIVNVGAYELITLHPRFYDRTITAAVQKHRESWMVRMSERENRIVDSQLLGWLVNANAFFASTSVITIGGLAALLGYGEKARLIINEIPYSIETTLALWDIKVIFLMSIMMFAFFKFAWAFRLSHYTVILLGATPECVEKDKAARTDHALRAARLLGLVGHHSNHGLRSFYYTIAGLMWFYHPAIFMAATTWVIAILLRREYASASRRILRGE